MPVSADQLAGMTFGKYQPVRLLGQGNLSVVYAGQYSGQSQPVMLTIFTLPQECIGSARERFMVRFEQEASALTRLNHPHIVRVYDFGIQNGYPYLVTPLVDGSSLAVLLKQQTRCTPEQTLVLLKQMAAGLDYAHANGIVHGALKPAQIFLDGQQTVRIAGFGLAHLSEMRGIGSIKHVYPHLFNVAGTFLTIPEYLAPEVVQGSVADARSDIYSLGIILFEMLAGRPPFTGSDQLAVALQHVEQRMPSLQEISPDAPIALDFVLQRVLEREPERRLQSAEKLVTAFERTMSVIQEASSSPNYQLQANIPAFQPQINWDTSSPQQPSGVPSFTSGKLPIINNTPTLVSGPLLRLPGKIDSGSSAKLPGVSNSLLTGKTVTTTGSLTQPVREASAQERYPIASKNQWPSIAATSNPFRGTADPGTFKANVAPPEPSVGSHLLSQKVSRRTVLVASGGVAALVLVGGAGISLIHLLQNANRVQNTGQANTTAGSKAKPAASPVHQGTVIDGKKLGNNTAQNFVNPADNSDSILIHLLNGSFVAYERACTHEGVPVNYNPDTHQLICPRHHSIYDPANNAAVVSGPAPLPLKKVAVHVNTDGTITVG